MAALTRSGARNASEIVMLTLRTLQSSRRAIASALIAGLVMSSLNHRRPLAIEAMRRARFSDRIGRGGCEDGGSGNRTSLWRVDVVLRQGPPSRCFLFEPFLLASSTTT